MPVLKYRDPQDGQFKLIELTTIGATGPTGPIGPSGIDASTATRVVNFPVPSATWTVESDHLVDVVVIDSGGTVVEPGGIIYQGTNTILQFSAAFSGTVYCF